MSTLHLQFEITEEVKAKIKTIKMIEELNTNPKLFLFLLDLYKINVDLENEISQLQNRLKIAS